MPYTHPEFLISPAELAADLDIKRVLDATVFLSPAPKGGYRAESGLERFNEGHIPGALFLDLVGEASDTSTGLGFTLPPAAQLERLFARLGVSNDTEVVLYSSGHIMWATRAWWLAALLRAPAGAGAQRWLEGLAGRRASPVNRSGEPS